ncbi:MAG: flavodoxin family protein [Desulfobacca sp.]|uniref:flavodoxin family protein n=1 Tax=Desulfobacca sp. TaxID=2067990 RepID=UPI00404B6152
MRALAISGSPRQEGNTWQLLQVALEVLAAEGLQTELISLHNKVVHPCLACGTCQKKQNQCVQEDDFQEVLASMHLADVLLIGSPVYFGSATPNLMALLDRAGYLARYGDNRFFRKVGAPIVVARRAGVNFTYAQLLFFFMIMGMVVPGSSYWPIAYGLQPGDALQDHEGVETVKNLAKNLAWVAKKLR